MKHVERKSDPICPLNVVYIIIRYTNVLSSQTHTFSLQLFARAYAVHGNYYVGYQPLVAFDVLSFANILHNFLQRLQVKAQT